MEGLNKSILDLSARRKSGTCPDLLTPNQMLTHLIAGKPSLVCGTSCILNFRLFRC